MNSVNLFLFKRDFIFRLLCSLTILFFTSSILSQDHRAFLLKFNDEIPISGSRQDVGQSIQYLHTTFQNYPIEKTVLLRTGTDKNLYRITFREPVNLKHLGHIIRENKHILFMEPDFIGTGGGHPASPASVPNDEYFIRQWNLKNTGSFPANGSKAGADINIVNAWQTTTGSEDLIIASLDSGAKLNHPEFSGRIWENEMEISDGIDNDQNGYTDDTQGWDFVSNDNLPSDDHGHGTNVTGILGATGGNELGYAGVNWKSKIMVLKILDRYNSGYYSWWIEAIYYAVDHGAKVINMSVGGSSYSQAMHEAIRYAVSNNVTVVACMMNENSNQLFYPAAYDEVIAVGSTDADDQRSYDFGWGVDKGSNFGNHIDISAPGNRIYGLSYTSDNNFNTYWSGTSQATPHVSGAASLLLSINPLLSPQEVKEILIQTADDQVGLPTEDTPGWDQFHGHGRLNVSKAIDKTITTRVSEMVAEQTMIFPNPVFSGTLIHIASQNSELSEISLLSIQGKMILNDRKPDYQMLIPENLTPGTYILRITFNDRTTVDKKLIVL